MRYTKRSQTRPERKRKQGQHNTTLTKQTFHKQTQQGKHANTLAEQTFQQQTPHPFMAPPGPWPPGTGPTLSPHPSTSRTGQGTETKQTKCFSIVGGSKIYCM